MFAGHSQNLMVRPYALLARIECEQYELPSVDRDANHSIIIDQY